MVDIPNFELFVTSVTDMDATVKLFCASPKHIEQVKSSAFISLMTQNLDFMDRLVFIHCDCEVIKKFNFLLNKFK